MRQPSDQRRRHDARGRRQHRDLAVPDRWPRRALTAASGGRGDVRGEGRACRPSALLGKARSPLGAPAHSAQRLPPSTRVRRVHRPLPAEPGRPGYSSLANLRRLPINELKIDRSFISPLLNDESDLIIVRSTINLGHDLGLTVIAEGVEDELTLKRLEMLGCDLAQGYHLSRPLPADAFGDWIGHAGERREKLGASAAAAS